MPEHLKCKTDLKTMGLKPGVFVKAKVWNSYIWVELYDIHEAVPKRKPTEKQLAALEKARQKQKELDICPICKEDVGRKNLILNSGGILACEWCHHVEQMKVKKKRGEEVFRRWFDEDFVILDTETTGLDGAEIVEIAIIDRMGHVLFDSLVKPNYPIPDEVMEIHGITNDRVAIAPTGDRIWEDIQSILQDRKILIYNDELDVQMISNSCHHYQIQPIHLNTECVMRTYANYIGSDRWLKLSDAADRWTSHRALEDCFATLKVITNVWIEMGLMNELKETS
ncbi:3'-5' exonuclease [Ammoniphilus sp. YIM 78166]|uniref:3'-5' exonuclease n=1 Tax=Ammoniphilus sp. YIM 78166 TaxID=1644106 RepID=UPI0010702910|nr:3'-5' exonuclease [Ammoniphilus sp. YIM 78166]